MGVSPRSIRRYKQGTRTPRFDIAYKIKIAEKRSRGLRKTKSIKKKRQRSEALVKKHPEIKYFEGHESYKYADTEHLILYDVSKDDIPDLIRYLEDQGYGAAFLVISGKNDKTGERDFYSTEVMVIDDFAESWEDLYEELWTRYALREAKDHRVDLVGIMYHAPTPIER